MKSRLSALVAGLLLLLPAFGQAPLPDGSLRFLVVGDWGRRGAHHQKETAGQMGRTAAATAAQFVVATGDNIYDDGVASVHDSLWKYSFEDIYTAPSLQIPWYVSLGNHDYRTNPQAQVEYTLFSPRWKMPARYYNVVWQITPEVSAEFFIVDTSPFISGYYNDPKHVKSVTGQDTKAQLAWLERKLAASTARWKFVVGHHTIYSSSAKHGDNEDMIRTFRPLLEKYGVQAYINGHDHDMEVIKEGPVYYITSGAGSKVRGEMNPGANSLFANGTESGFLAASLTADRLDFRFIDWAGKELFKSSIPRSAPVAAAVVPAAPYRIVARWPLGGLGTNDYMQVDPATRRPFVSHQSILHVLDADTGKILAEFTGQRGAHGVALAHDVGLGFISNGVDGTVNVFDLATLRPTRTIQTAGQKPDGIAYDPGTHQVIVSNNHASDLTLIDARTCAITGTVTLPGNPESVAIDGQGRAFVNLESRSAIARFNLTTRQVEAEWQVAPGEEPTGLAFDAANRRLFAGCHNRTLVVLDADTGRKIATVPIGDYNDAVAYDAAAKLIFCSNKEGNVTVVRQDGPDAYSVAQTIATKFGAKTLARDAARDRIFVAASNLGPVPAPTKDNPKPGAPILPGSFEVLVIGR